MRKGLVIAAALVVVAGVAGCGKSDADKQREMDVNLKLLGEKYIKAKLKDPSSAEFRNQFIGIKGAPCGEVNSKNSFGGFTGFQRYIVAGKDMAVTAQDMAPGEFETSWSQICR